MLSAILSSFNFLKNSDVVVSAINLFRININSPA